MTLKNPPNALVILQKFRFIGLNKQENAKFEFRRIFDLILWLYYLIKFDEILKYDFFYMLAKTNAFWGFLKVTPPPFR